MATSGILTPEICHDLYRLAFKGDTTGSRTGRAIAVLAHEAWHLRGTGDEGTTECYALQSGVELGTRLGLSEDTARQLMRQQLIENQLRGASTLEYRIPPECRNGGRLDLDPGSTAVPVSPGDVTGHPATWGSDGRYWARTSDPQLVELVLSQLS